MAPLNLKSLPLGATRAHVTIAGDADYVLAVLERMDKSAELGPINIEVLVKRADWGREFWSVEAVKGGDADNAFRGLDRLARQARIDATVEKKLSDLIIRAGVVSKAHPGERY